MRKQFKCVLTMLALFSVTSLSAQTEVMAWGNMSGIRVDGEFMEFESSRWFPQQKVTQFCRVLPFITVWNCHLPVMAV